MDPRPDAPVDVDVQPDLDALLELAIRAARAAGSELLQRHGNVQGLQIKSSATDPVSDADRAAEELLVSMISAERPDDGILGEEGASVESRTGITWVVDPLDGTVNYLYELGNYAVSVAAEDSQGSLVGAVFDVTRNVMYSAARGRGASRNGQRIRCAAAVPAGQALVATGFGYDAEWRARQGALIGALLGRVRDIRRIGSAALDLCWVGTGALNAYYEEGVHRWDVAAGGLVASEAGAVVIPFAPLRGETGVLAAAAGLNEELSVILKNLSGYSQLE
jgi:myo-inositol-1(or 4)-monophosphatase